MDTTILIISIVIQAFAILMVLYTFYSISRSSIPKLAALEEYYLMRRRYERLRTSLLFIGALIAVQLGGVFYYFWSGTFPVLQLLISDAVIVALTIFLTRIYKERRRLSELEPEKKTVKKEETTK
jgi:undecaprenyl pyrophosphate phosphatase UppP